MNKAFVFSISNCFDSNFQMNYYQDFFLSLKSAAPAAQDCFSLIMQDVKSWEEEKVLEKVLEAATGSVL